MAFKFNETEEKEFCQFLIDFKGEVDHKVPVFSLPSLVDLLWLVVDEAQHC